MNIQIRFIPFLINFYRVSTCLDSSRTIFVVRKFLIGQLLYVLFDSCELCYLLHAIGGMLHHALKILNVT